MLNKKKILHLIENLKIQITKIHIEINFNRVRSKSWKNLMKSKLRSKDRNKLWKSIKINID